MNLDINNPMIIKIAQTARNVAGWSEREYFDYIRKEAIKNNINYEDLLFAVRTINKEIIFSGLKNVIKFYHSTSIDSFQKIIQSGALLSREEQRKLGIDTSRWFKESSERWDDVRVFNYDTEENRSEIFEQLWRPLIVRAVTKFGFEGVREMKAIQNLLMHS